MTSSCRILLIKTILILLIVQIHGGYWVCDWVTGRGWMYCARGVCNSFLGKRSLTTDYEQTSPVQNTDGTYCVDKDLCYTCQPVNEHTCRIMLQREYVPILKSDLHTKRSDEDICS